MDDDDTEVEMIELLDDQFTDALLGAVYDEKGTPVPCYSSAMVMDKLLMDGHDEASAMEAVEAATDGMKMLWIHPLELEPEFTPDTKPFLRLVH
jgi:hypothetical protein